MSHSPEKLAHLHRGLIADFYRERNAGQPKGHLSGKVHDVEKTEIDLALAERIFEIDHEATHFLREVLALWD